METAAEQAAGSPATGAGGSPPDHEILPRAGTVYSAGPRRMGLPADVLRENHYPLTAICAGCGEVIRLEHFIAIGDGGQWQHTGRKAGDPE